MKMRSNWNNDTLSNIKPIQPEIWETRSTLSQIDTNSRIKAASNTDMPLQIKSEYNSQKATLMREIEEIRKSIRVENDENDSYVTNK